MVGVSRRNILLSGLYASTAHLVALPASARTDSAVPRADVVTHGPMLGNVTAHSVRVWARTAFPTTLRVIIAKDMELVEDRHESELITHLADDFTGWVEIANLSPGSRYYYALAGSGQENGLPSVVRSFRTLFTAELFIDEKLNPDGLFNFAFEAGSCNDQSWRTTRQNMPPTYATMRRKLAGKIDFQILNGDFIYEDGRDVTAADWADKFGVVEVPANVRYAQGLTGVWENYRLYLDGDQEMAEFLAEVPFFATLDDHEILNDVTGSGQSGLRTDARNKPFQQDIASRFDFDAEVERAVFRDPALAAWDDYVGWCNPSAGARQDIHFGETRVEQGSDILRDTSADFTLLDPDQTSNLHVLWGFGNTGVYEIVEVIGPHEIKLAERFTVSEKVHYSIGNQKFASFRVSNAEFFLIDVRSNRTSQEVPGSNGQQHSALLGATQMEWLKTGMRESTASFIFIVSPVNVVLPHDNGVWYGQGVSGDSKNDGWTSQFEERAEILDIAEALEKPVIFLSADLHRSFMARIAPGVYDVGTGPHSSRVHRLGDAGGSPPSGWYESGDRLVNIIWSSNQYRNDSDRDDRRPGNDWPIYTVIRVNNAYNVPARNGSDRWIAFPEPQLIFEFYDGFTGELVFANAISTSEAKQEARAVPMETVKLLGGID